MVVSFPQYFHVGYTFLSDTQFRKYLSNTELYLVALIGLKLNNTLSVAYTCRPAVGISI
jgi:hypothetical protein